MNKGISVALAGCLLLGASSAWAQGFAKSGQIAISSDFEIAIESTSFSEPDGAPEQDSQTTIEFAPGLDYFVTDGVSVGGQLVYASVSQGDVSASAFGIGPRVGYGMAFSPTLSIFPRVALVYLSTSTEIDDGMGGTLDASGSQMALQLYVPLQIHPAEHFFIGIGPSLSMDLSNKIEDNDGYKATTIGLTSVVGGYFGG